MREIERETDRQKESINLHNIHKIEHQESINIHKIEDTKLRPIIIHKIEHQQKSSMQTCLQKYKTKKS